MEWLLYFELAIVIARAVLGVALLCAIIYLLLVIGNRIK